MRRIRLGVSKLVFIQKSRIFDSLMFTKMYRVFILAFRIIEVKCLAGGIVGSRALWAIISFGEDWADG
jgi:hypothetical protein